MSEIPHSRLARPSLVSDQSENPDRIMLAAPDRSEPVDALEELTKLISLPPKVPEVGLRASEAMNHAIETTALDIEQFCQDGVDRALAIQQQGQTFATILRESGKLLCTRIEDEATRGLHISELMRRARDHFGIGGAK